MRHDRGHIRRSLLLMHRGTHKTVHSGRTEMLIGAQRHNMEDAQRHTIVDPQRYNTGAREKHAKQDA